MAVAPLRQPVLYEDPNPVPLEPGSLVASATPGYYKLGPSSGAPPTGAAGGDLAGTYPNPTMKVLGAATGPLGTASTTPSVTIDAKGRVTGLTSQSIQIAESQVTNLSTDLGNKVAKADYTAADKYLYGTGAGTYTQGTILSGWRNWLATTKAVWTEASGYLGVGGTPSTKLHIVGTSATLDVIRTDQGLDFYPITKPASMSVALAGAGVGNVNNGLHYYFVTYYSLTGETDASAAASVTVVDATTDGKVTVTIPVSSDYRTVGRKIYRTSAASLPYGDPYLLATVANNTDVTYLDNIADASRPGTTSVYYRENTTNRFVTVAGTASMFLGSTSSAFGTGALLGLAAGTNIGGQNTAFGANAGRNVTTGTRNNFIGNSAGSSCTGGSDNVLIGDSAGALIANGATNVFIGRNTAYNQTGSYNVALGSGAGFGTAGASGSQNTLLGFGSGYAVSTGSSNTLIGLSAGNNITSGSTNIILGTYVTAPVATGSRQLNIGNLLYGINVGPGTYPGGSTPVSNASVGIGLTTPTARLHLPAGVITAGLSPLKLTSGPLLTATEAGAVEFLTDDILFTITTGAGTAVARKRFVLEDTVLVSSRVPFATTNGRLTDTASLTWVAPTLTAPTFNATTGLVLPKTSGTGIKVDNTTPTYPWKDLLGDIIIQRVTATNPTWALFRTPQEAWSFSSGGGANEVFNRFHIPHDYVMGTDLYIHAHWAQNVVDTGGTAGVPGAVKWNFDISYAKGHGTAGGAASAFPASKTVSVTQQGTTTQYGHMIAEVVFTSAGGSATLTDNALIEPDGVVLVRTWRLDTDASDTLNQAPFLFYVDLHFQSTGVGTKQKSPPFWT